MRNYRDNWFNWTMYSSELDISAVPRLIHAIQRRDPLRGGYGIMVAASIVLGLLLLGWGGLHVLANGKENAVCELPGTLRLQPDPALLDVGDVVTVEVWLEDAGNYYGIDIRLSFDPRYVQVPAGRVLPLWDVIDGNNHFIIKNEADNSSGLIWYAVTSLNPAQPFTGTGRICALAFYGLAAGTSYVSFTYAKGSTRDGIGMYPGTQDGTVMVRLPERYMLYLPLVSRRTVATQWRGK